MGCVHMHQGIFAIEEWGNPNYVQNVMEKFGENNQKARKTSWTISQTLTPRLEHDKIWTQWALDILLENMLENDTMV